MNIKTQIIRRSTFCLLLLLGACGGDEDSGEHGGAGTPPPGTIVGAAGGTVLGPSGAKVVIPPGALAADTTIVIEQTSTGSPALHGGFAAFGQMFAFMPHGTTFAVPVSVTVPFDPDALPAGATPALYKTNAQNRWEQVVSATFGTDTATAQVTSFSWVQLDAPLIRNDPTRAWEFRITPGTADELSLGGATQVGGVLEQFVDFGAAPFDVSIIGLTQTRPADGQASGYIFGTPDGVTYGVYAESPFARLGGADPIGSAARLEQAQSFIKRSADASLSFTVTKVLISAVDSFPHFASLPGQTDTWIKGDVYLGVEAYTPSESFYRAESGATLTGSHDQWVPEILTYYASRTPLFTGDDFAFSVDPNPPETCPGSRGNFELRQPRTYTVDLSTIAIGEEFTLRFRTFARTNNRRGAEVPEDCQTTGVNAYLRDPLGTGGTTLMFSGLEPTNNPTLVPPAEVPVEPASCLPGPGPDPAAGVLEFSAANYSIGEHAADTPVITVTRSGGSVGAVTATFTASDGSAVGGTDYSPVNVSVHFADSDAAPRVVPVTIISNQVDAPDKTVNLLLSEPGGCAALGPQDTATLTIRDDDLPPPGPGGVLDGSFGIAGKVTTVGFGGNDSAMALQPDGKIVMVGGTQAGFAVARYDAAGRLDTDFGNGGLITTGIGLALGPDLTVARGVAIQPDGKIVVVGYTQYFSFRSEERTYFALVRYNVDGSLDASFGSGGIVSVEGPELFRVGAAGRALAVAIQPDGKLLVAGDLPYAAIATVARYNADGSLDGSFGTLGQLPVPISTVGDGVNLVLQPNGAFVVSASLSSNGETRLGRYDSDGSSDASFGVNGNVTTSALISESLALQGDGKLLLAGNVNGSGTPASNQFAVMRLNADGSPDDTFGTDGAVSTDITGRGDIAYAVAVQSDGKILAAGMSSLTTDPNFAVVRYNSDGTLDGGFADAGKLTIEMDVGATDVAENVAVQADGKIVLGGWSQFSVEGYALARMNP